MKVDCQAGIGLAGSALGGGPAMGKQYHAALEDSVEHHFPGNHCINCMCHSTENLYRSAVWQWWDDRTGKARISDPGSLQQACVAEVWARACSLAQCVHSAASGQAMTCFETRCHATVRSWQ